MTSKQFKTDLQNEIKANGFTTISRTVKPCYYKIEKIGEFNGRTSIRFSSQPTPSLVEWLNKRFPNGVSLNATDFNLVIVNAPIDKK